MCDLVDLNFLHVDQLGPGSFGHNKTIAGIRRYIRGMHLVAQIRINRIVFFPQPNARRKSSAG